MVNETNNSPSIRVRVLSRNLNLTNTKQQGLQWLIGSPFFPQFTIISTIRCIQTQTPIDFAKEASDLRPLILRGFDVIGALLIGERQNARSAIDAARRMREALLSGGGDHRGICGIVGAVGDVVTGKIEFFVAKAKNFEEIESVRDVVYEDFPEKWMWERGCLVKCELGLKVPIYVPVNKPNDSEAIFSAAVDAAVSKFRDPKIVYMIEGAQEASGAVPQPVIVRGVELDFNMELSDVAVLKENSDERNAKNLCCSYFCSRSKPVLSLSTKESADVVQVSILLNQSGISSKSSAPIAEYFPAPETVKLIVVSFKMEVLCYVAKDLSVAYAITKLIVPGIADQLKAMKKVIMPNLLGQHPQLRPYHFCPPGVLNPVTVIYELNYGETEMKQVEIRRSLHLKLGLPLDRPLLLISNSLTFATNKGTLGSNSTRKVSTLLKDVHADALSSGVSGGLISVVDGSYEYYHYLQDNFDDSGWGCAYRSLQTIISWFKLQNYSSIEVPTHREIQQALVEIGDKDPSFIGSREWIGAIELSFVLDKLLGVSCKVLNVRSGAELPEKCRELGIHFQTQGTPVMIGGGVLAYTLLGVDYNEASGNCAFLILDPHYTGNDELKKIVNGGWCGWKKAVDNKGRNFFLHDKFYNLLLPQRPSMV